MKAVFLTAEEIAIATQRKTDCCMCEGIAGRADCRICCGAGTVEYIVIGAKHRGENAIPVQTEVR